jgi:hypothetical protein
MSDKKNKYSVSLVYENTKNIILRSIITDARSQHEAIGIAVEHFSKEAKTDNYRLVLQCSILINL